MNSGVFSIVRVMTEPGSNKTRKISFLVAVNMAVSLQGEALLFAKGPDDAGALHSLVEVAVDRRAAHCLQPSQLTR